jgi:hypothetical protein
MQRSPPVCRSLWERDGSDRLAIYHQRCSDPQQSRSPDGMEEREEIALLWMQGHSMREIRRRIGRPASTISRELRCSAAQGADPYADRVDIALLLRAVRKHVRCRWPRGQTMAGQSASLGVSISPASASWLNAADGFFSAAYSNRSLNSKAPFADTFWDAPAEMVNASAHFCTRHAD